MTIENRLTQDQDRDAADFLNKLSPADRQNVMRVMDIVDSLAARVESHLPDYSDLSSIFGVYAIGGNVNKEGPRPDIDLLVMTNAKWHMMYWSLSHGDPKDFTWGTKFEPALSDLANHFGNNGFDVVIPPLIPDEYFLGVDPRAMIRLLPQAGTEASPIDLIYISGANGNPPIKSFEDFYQRDISGEKGIGRLALVETFVPKPLLPLR